MVLGDNQDPEQVNFVNKEIKWFMPLAERGRFLVN